MARPELTQELDVFDDELARLHMRGQWQYDKLLVKAIGGPRPAGEPWIWRWETVYPQLLRACEVLPESFTARRHLLFLNPGLESRGTTHTMAMGIQMIRPGELAWAHRHSIAALRFVIKGSSSLYTVVDGEVCPMEDYDLILTPQWSWHDHANETDHPVIWLDVLDVPFIMAINQWFWEPFPDEIQPRSRPRGENLRRFGAGIVRPVGPLVHDGPSPLLVYPWDRTETTLCELAELDEGDGDVTVEYNNPLTGGPVLPTIGCYAHMLRPGALTRPRRTNASAVLHVVRGRGCTTVGDQKLEWETGDCLAIPHWTWVHHENRSATEPAFLFSSTDAPILEAFGIHREEVSGGHGR